MYDYIIYCDEKGSPTGEIEDKLLAHHENTRLHLAFSVFFV